MLFLLGVKKWRRASGNEGGVATIQLSTTDTILFVRNSAQGNGAGIYCNSQAVFPQSFYDVAFNGTTVTLTPNTAVSGYIDYIEF